MRLPWISRKEHNKELALKDNIIKGWINKCNKLDKDIVEKEDKITNLLDYNMEFALENQHLRSKVRNLDNMIKWHESNECKLNKELCMVKVKLDKANNTYRMLTGKEIE